jgi:hypothetical protein
MPRKNWGQRSGVIVDVCSAHGIWFDADELAGVLRWVRDGGLEQPKPGEGARTMASPPPAPLSPGPTRWDRRGGGGWLGSVLEVLIWVGLDRLID